MLPEDVVNGPDALWVADRHERVVVWSHGATELLGYAPEEVIGGCAWQTLFPQDLLENGEPGEIARQLTEDRSLRDHRTRLVSRDRKELSVYLDGMPITDAHGRFSGTLLVARSHPTNGDRRRWSSSRDTRAATPLFDGPKPLLGRSDTMRGVMETVARVARSDASVVISGESGTGKELLAHAIHLESPRRCCPFVTINCAAIPEHLLESELFGHERGAFTGADKRRIGRFERASCGTVFLDEIGDMELSLQAKILRALDSREIERVGGDRTIPVDVRVVSASHRCLRTDIAEGRFRQDLYYRLAVVVIDVPPLRVRGDDVFLLAEYFLRQFADRNRKSTPTLSSEVRRLMREYPWPGNVRELKNAMEHAVLMETAGTVSPEHLPPAIVDADPVVPEVRNGEVPGGPGSLRDTERHHIAHVMASVQGNQKRAAEVLGIHRNTLRAKLRQFDLA